MAATLDGLMNAITHAARLAPQVAEKAYAEMCWPSRRGEPVPAAGNGRGKTRGDPTGQTAAVIAHARDQDLAEARAALECLERIIRRRQKVDARSRYVWCVNGCSPAKYGKKGDRPLCKRCYAKEYMRARRRAEMNGG